MGAKGWLRLPPLAVGIGIYLPMSATLPMVIGAVIGWLYDRRHPDPISQRMGVLLASGFIVGESLFGVLLAGVIVATGSGTPYALDGEGGDAPDLVELPTGRLARKARAGSFTSHTQVNHEDQRRGHPSRQHHRI